MQAGGKLIFEDMDWKGIYQLKPFPIYDAAKRLTSNMYIPGTMMCLSFHIKDMIDEEGWNMYMTPEQAARGLTLMQNYPESVPDIPEDPPYRDLTEFDLFKNIEVR